jgi:hypothetical protein
MGCLHSPHSFSPERHIYIDNTIMHLLHHTSSLAFDSKIDGVYGKFFPSRNKENVSNAPVTIYSEIYGVYGNLTKRFAERLDDFVVSPSENGALGENFLLDHFPLDLLIAIAEEPHFWERAEKYQWFEPLFRKMFLLCRGNMYLLMDWEYREQLTDRIRWCERSFGTTLADNLILTADKNRALLVGGYQDLLIDTDLYNIERWINAGGSAFYWPEINHTCPPEMIAKIVARRLGMLEDVVKHLNNPLGKK